MKDTYQNAFVVSREHLNELGKDLNLVQYIEQSTFKPFGENIHGIYLNLVGAIYLDRGYVYCEKLFKRVELYVDIARLEGKVISYSLVIMVKKENISLRYLKTMQLTDNDSIGQTESKTRKTVQKESRKSIPTCLFCISRKNG
jgi:hypothetical protein